MNKSLLIRDILIKDQLADTLIYAEKIDVNAHLIDIRSKKIDFNHIIISGFKSNIYHIQDSLFNYSFFLNEFKSDSNQEFAWQLSCKILKLNDSKVDYTPENGLHQQVSHLKFIVKDLVYTKDQLSLVTTHLSTWHNNKPLVNRMSFHLNIIGSTIKCEQFILLSKNSLVDINSSQITFDDNKQLYLSAVINPSQINLSDFATLNSKFESISENIKLSGNIEFNPKTISGEELLVKVGKCSKLSGNLQIANYSDKEKLSFNINFKEAYTNRTDIAYLSKLFFNADTNKIPDELNRFGDISYTGRLIGASDSVYSEGEFFSAAGHLTSNLSIHKVGQTDSILINGNIKTAPFYLDKITLNKSLGDLSLDMNTYGSYSKKSGVHLNLNGIVNHVDFNEYSLDSVVINGHLEQDYFKGRISSYDPSLRTDFEGEVHFGNKPSYNFVSNIYYANLSKLGIDKSDTSSNISVNINAQFEGEFPHNSFGTINISDLYYFKDTIYLATDSIQITAQRINGQKQITLNSEFFDGKIEGNYNLTHLFNDMKLFAQHYMSNIPFTNDTVNSNDNNFSFYLNAKYPNPITQVFAPKLNIAPGTTINGQFDASHHNLFFTLNSASVQYANQSLSQLKVRAYTKQNRIYLDLTSDEVKFTQSNSLKNLSLSINLTNNKLSTNLNWNNWLDQSYSGNINSMTTFLPGFNKENENFKIEIYPSNIIIVDTLWAIHECSIENDSSGIKFNNIRIDEGISSMSINGKLSANPNDSIVLNFEDLNLSHLNILLNKKGVDFGGTVSGYSILRDIKGKRKFDTDLKIKDLSINNQKIGDTYFYTKWDKTNSQLNLIGRAIADSDTTLNITGYIAPIKEDINIDAYFKNQNLNFLDAFLTPTFQNITGTFSGDVKIHGSPKAIQWDGKVYVDSGRLEVESTKVFYHFSDTVLFKENKIIFKNITAYDDEKNSALMNGIVYHDVDFKEFGVNFKFNTNRILGVDTKYNDSPLYYGKIYGSGDVTIKGPTTDIYINVVATTLNHSRFYIPLEAREDIKENEFIRFVKKETEKTKKQNKKTNEIIKSNTTLNIDLTVTPATEIQIIFDPKIGDILKANGSAQITMESKGDYFGMFGDFIIEKGDYLFTLQDVINKRLQIVQGSSVSWNGDPLDADINVDAIYHVRKASIYDLTLSESDRDKRIPVNCHMLMTNKLVNPDIKFSIEITSNTNNEAIDQLNNLPEDELNKQIITLLLMNKFSALSNASYDKDYNTTASLGATTASELLSNQLSNWLSQLNSDFDLGFTLRPGTETTDAEYELAMSTTLWDDRVTVYGNLGYGGQNTETESSTNSPYTTDFSVELKLTKKGNIRVLAFQKENEDIDELDPAPYKQGIGIFYTEEFNRFDELLKRMFRKQYAKKPDDIEVENDTD